MKIQAEIDKVKAKIADQQARLKELEKNKLEAENSEIVDIVRGMSIPLAELPLLFEKLKSGGALGHFVPKSSGFGELPNKHFCGASGPAKIAGVATPALLAVSCDPATWRKNGGHAFSRILRFPGLPEPLCCGFYYG